MNKDEELRDFIEKDSNYKAKKKRQIRSKLYNKDGNITRDIGFELMFGFDDKSDPNMYNEGIGMEVQSNPLALHNLIKLKI